MKKIGKCKEVQNIYFGLFTTFFSFVIILLAVYLLKIRHMQQNFIEIVYMIFIGICFLLAIRCFVSACYIFGQKDIIFIIDEQTFNVCIQYRKTARILPVADIEDIQIQQGFIFLNHLMKSTILIYMKQQIKPFKIRYAYPPLVIKNEILKLKEKV